MNNLLSPSTSISVIFAVAAALSSSQVNTCCRCVQFALELAVGPDYADTERSERQSIRVHLTMEVGTIVCLYPQLYSQYMVARLAQCRHGLFRSMPLTSNEYSLYSLMLILFCASCGLLAWLAFSILWMDL